MELLLLGLMVSFNFIVLIRKYRLGRYADATLDMSLLAILCFLFSGSFNALIVGSFASLFISIYLYFRPIYIFKSKKDEYDENEYEEYEN